MKHHAAAPLGSYWRNRSRFDVLGCMGPSLSGYLPPSISQSKRRLRRCADLADIKERRSGLDRRLAVDRRHVARGDPKEQINLRLHGERRTGVTDRRSGFDRRSGIDIRLSMALPATPSW